MIILTLLAGTIRELTSKATLYVLAGISTVILLGVLVAVSSTTTPAGTALTLLGNDVSPPVPQETFAGTVMQIEASLAAGLFFGVVLFGLFATAGVIPDALDKGTVDLYLSKPIARWEFLLGKSLGSICGILINVIYFVSALCVILGLRVGVWNVHLITSAFLMTVAYAALYSIVVFFGVLSRNMAIAIIAGFLYLVVFDPLLENRASGLYLISTNVVYRGALDGLFFALPQIGSTQANVLRLIGGASVDWKPIGQCLLSSLVIFLGTTALLERKEF
jgi:ABC-type transport system involved in multi-copper enzyme maturation permease subunit